MKGVGPRNQTCYPTAPSQPASKMATKMISKVEQTKILMELLKAKISMEKCATHGSQS